MALRLLSRFYPALYLSGPPGETRDRLEGLALAINPAIDLSRSGHVDGGIAIGLATGDFERTVHAASDGWTSFVSSEAPVGGGGSPSPYGAGAAGAIAAANLFRWLLLEDSRLDIGLAVPLNGLVSDRPVAARPTATEGASATLVGLGAIGSAAAWALARSSSPFALTLVDHEDVELSNIQRYLLAERGDEGAAKVDVAARAFSDPAMTFRNKETLSTFVSHRSSAIERMLLALDSARDRRAAQASLPRWIANAWTQTNDLGVSVHPVFGGGGACVACLYLPTASADGDDVIVSRALGVPERSQEVRTLLQRGLPVGTELLTAIGNALSIDSGLLAPYEGRPIRDLYVEGFCGGGVIPLGAGPRPDGVHVPLAHQSALAGVLLAAALECELSGCGPSTTVQSHIDPSRPFPAEPRQYVRARRSGRCICGDPDYVRVYRHRFGRAIEK